MRLWNHKPSKLKPASPLFEACWKIRTRIDAMFADTPCPVLIVTSAGKSEGKTTTAVNLACSYALQNKNVLLVDANLRNPALHKLFGVSNRSGFANLPGQVGERNEIVRCSPVPGLALVTSGPAAFDPAELLTSAAVAAFLKQCKQEFDIVLIDTPAALEWTDAHMLASIGDGVLLVVKEGKAKQEDLRRLKASMEQIGASIVGAVFRQARRRKVSAG